MEMIFKRSIVDKTIQPFSLLEVSFYKDVLYDQSVKQPTSALAVLCQANPDGLKKKSHKAVQMILSKLK